MRLILTILLLAYAGLLSAAPGDILFSDDFEGGFGQWTVTAPGVGDASIGAETANSPTQSMRLRWDTVTATTTNPIPAAVPAAQLTAWIRRGDDTFSEDPDTNEDLVVEFLDNTNTWIALETFTGAGTPGEVFNRTYALPASALHAGLRIRFRYLQGSGPDFDYWHVDDVVVTEIAQAGNVQVTLSGTVREINAGAISVTGAASGAPEATNTNTNTSTATITTGITTLTDNAWLFDVVGSGNGGSYTPGGGQSERWDTSAASATGASSTKPVPSAGADSMTQTHSTTSIRTAHAVIAVAPAAASIAFDAASSANTTNSNTISWMHTIVDDTNSKLVVGVAVEGNDGQCNAGSEVVTGVTFDGTPLTFAAGVTIDTGFCQRVEIWFLDIVPPPPLFLEVDTVTLNDTLSTPSFTSVTFRQTYPVAPLVFALPTQEGGQPAALRIRNVTTTGFEISQVEPETLDGGHIPMTVDYIVITPGVHTLPDGRTIEAGTHTTQSIQHGAGVPGGQNWDTVNFSTTFAGTPSVLLHIQELANESSNPPSTTSIPWLTASIQNVGTTSFQTALERSEVDDGGSINSDETIAYLAIEGNVQGSFTAEGMTILYESIISADNINGWDNENCAGGVGQSVPFVNSYTSTPLAVAHTNRHDGGDGGWIRRCSIDTSQIGLAYDEDQFRDGERNHTTEAASVLVFSEAFCLPDCVTVVVDHYAISFPNGSIGITCEPSAVLITAHDSSDNPVNVPGGTTLDITSVIDGTATLSGEWDNATGGGSLSGNPGNPVTYTWPASPEETSVTLELRQLATGTLDINLDDGIATELEDPTIEFRDAIFRVVDATATPVAITSKLSGKQSNIAGTGFQNLFLQAIETNDLLECQTVFENQNNVTVQMASECNNPSSCESVNVEVENDSGVLVPIASNSNASVGSFTDIQFDFDADSKTPLRFVYDDAGEITLHTRFDLDPPNGVYMQGDSGPFVVRPAGLCVESTDANSDCASGDGTCSTFVKADETFNLTVRGVTWESDGETDSDFCTGSNVTTPNFELSAITLTHGLVAPAGGDPGTLGIVNIDIVDADQGSETLSSQTISEVGVFTVTAVPPLYIGETIAAASSANIGRFFPDRFVVVSDGSPAFADECSTGTPFTYLDQTFRYGTPPALTLRALNVSGGTTLNYGQDFWKLVVTDLGRSYIDNAGAAASFSEIQDDTVTITGDTDLDGEGTLTLDTGTNGDAFMYSRVVEEAEFGADVDVTFSGFTGNVANTDDLTDTDNVCHDANDDGTCDDYTISNITGATLRFGRLVIGTAFGSELMPLAPVFRTQFFDNVSGSFITNTDDGCTSITATDLSLTSSIEGPETDGDVVITAGGSCPGPGNGCTTATVGNIPFVGGDGALQFSAPGADNIGHADITIDLSAVPLAPHPDMTWLRYDWDDDDGAGDGPYDDDPDGRVTFGIYQGPSDYIYIREPW